mgnify:CR=1 FL=1
MRSGWLRKLSAVLNIRRESRSDSRSFGPEDPLSLDALLGDDLTATMRFSRRAETKPAPAPTSMDSLPPSLAKLFAELEDSPL